MSTLRKRPADRIMGMLWGAIVVATGAVMLATFSGYSVDLELALIVALSAVGLYLLLSAALAGRRRPAPPPASDAPE